MAEIVIKLELAKSLEEQAQEIRRQYALNGYVNTITAVSFADKMHHLFKRQLKELGEYE